MDNQNTIKNPPIYPQSIQEKTPPAITQKVALPNKSRFVVEQHHLTFTNGEQRIYECLQSGKRGGVLVVPIDNDDNVLLIREYCGGVQRYELAFPKGKLESDESLQQAVVRELREETGYHAERITHLKSLTLAPNYMSHQTHVFCAEQLNWNPAQGDEPEPIEVYPWPLAKLPELLVREDFTEGRSIAALFLLLDFIKNRID